MFLTKKREGLVAFHRKTLPEVMKDCDDKVGAYKGRENDADNAFDRVRTDTATLTENFLAERNGAFGRLLNAMFGLRLIIRTREKKKELK